MTPSIGLSGRPAPAAHTPTQPAPLGQMPHNRSCRRQPGALISRRDPATQRARELRRDVRAHRRGHVGDACPPVCFGSVNRRKEHVGE
eukprot:scaffold34278_cov129-Isochrysis_galbana.AAC.1